MSAVFYLAYIRHVGPTSLQYRFPLMCEWEECNSFDMATGSTQTVSFHYASWGEQWSVARDRRSGWSSDSVSNIY